MGFLPALSLPLLAILVYEDQKHRAVSWIVFPFLALTFIACSLSYLSLVELLYNISYNLGFLLMQLLLISIYFSVKERRIIIITQNYLGVGDILFLICLAFLFSPINYIVFYFTSLFIILVGIFVYMIVKRNFNSRLPLAGFQSLLLLMAILVNLVYDSRFKFQNDYLIVSQFFGQ